MKKLFVLFSFLGLFAFAANAQQKACCASKSAATKAACTSSASADAEKAAENDASIVKQVSNTGEMSYTRKEVCPVTGKVTYNPVEYCSKSGRFINVSPSEKAAACAKEASANKSGKACCAGKEKGACCAKDAQKTSNQHESSDVKVKLVNQQENQ